MADIEKRMGIEDTADYLGIKPVTLRAWLKKENNIPARRVGKFWKFKRSELDAWIIGGGATLL